MRSELGELLLQALETEIAGAQVYQTALRCIINEELREEWEKYFDQTSHHVEVLHELFEKLGMDPEQETPGRKVIWYLGQSLVQTMEMAIKGCEPEEAELVACECVVLVETKDHLNWELIAQYAEKAKGREAQVLKAACQEVMKEENKHLYHTQGWCRELWIAMLGMPAILPPPPPPEEEKHVKTAAGAARGQQSRKVMLRH